jgi:hypothetical protein
VSVIHDAFADTSGFSRFYKEGSTEAASQESVADGVLTFSDDGGICTTRGEYASDVGSGYFSAVFLLKGTKAGDDFSLNTAAHVIFRGSVTEDGNDRDSNGYVARFTRNRVIVRTIVNGVTTDRATFTSGSYDVLTETFEPYLFEIYSTPGNTVVRACKAGRDWATYDDADAPAFAATEHGIIIGGSCAVGENIHFTEMWIDPWRRQPGDRLYLLDHSSLGLGLG